MVRQYAMKVMDETLACDFGSRKLMFCWTLYMMNKSIARKLGRTWTVKRFVVPVLMPEDSL